MSTSSNNGQQMLYRDGQGRKDEGGGGGSRSTVKQVVCEELCVTKLYVKDGVWQSGVKNGVWKMVCQRWCVKDGVWQSAATCRQVPRLPGKKPRRPAARGNPARHQS